MITLIIQTHNEVFGSHVFPITFRHLSYKDIVRWLRNNEKLIYKIISIEETL